MGTERKIPPAMFNFAPGVSWVICGLLKPMKAAYIPPPIASPTHMHAIGKKIKSCRASSPPTPALAAIRDMDARDPNEFCFSFFMLI
jgi:hypothetical protein